MWVCERQRVSIVREYGGVYEKQRGGEIPAAFSWGINGDRDIEPKYIIQHLKAQSIV